MDRDLGIFCQLILWIWDHRRRPDSYKANELGFYNKVQAMFNSLTSRKELENSLPTEEKVRNEFPSRKFMYLDPIETDHIMIPLIWMAFDFGRSIPSVRCYLGLFLHHENQIKSLGYRLETPEGVGIHHFYHAQIIRGLPPNIPFMPSELHQWLPERQPSFPLDADNPLRLILCLLLTLYGKEYINRLLVTMGAGLKNQIIQSVDEMSWNSIRPLRWYWVVRDRTNKQVRICYDSSKKPEDYNKILKNYPGCESIGVTRTNFNGQPGNKQSLND